MNHHVVRIDLLVQVYYGYHNQI